MDRRKVLRQTSWLAGAAITAPAMLSLLQSCKSESRLNWQPTFLANDEAEFISSIVDIILPKTDTPGALDVNVDVFLDRLWAETADETTQAEVKKDIVDFNDNCKETYGSVFAKCSKEDQQKALEAAEAASGTFNYNFWGGAAGKQEPVGFYRNLKSTAIWAYLSSEEIGKNVLSYDPVPGGYDGCIAADSVGNKWAL